MKQEDRLVSSTNINLIIDFRTDKNDKETLEILKKLQRINTIKRNDNLEIIYKIFNDDGAPFILLKTNLCSKPVKLLVDTGAAISIIASDLILENTKIIKYIINLFGISGKENAIMTKGLVNGVFIFGNNHLGTTLHLIDRVHSGFGDGFLGYDFISSYGLQIDIRKMTIQINLCDTEAQKNEISKEKDDNDNFLQILACSYDFDEINRSKVIFDQLKLSNCSSEEKNHIKGICEDFPYQFYLEGDHLSATDVIKHRIDLIPNSKIVNVRQYRVLEYHKKPLQDIITDYERQGIIEKCQSCYNSPVMLVGKKMMRVEKTISDS